MLGCDCCCNCCCVCCVSDELESVNDGTLGDVVAAPAPRLSSPSAATTVFAFTCSSIGWAGLLPLPLSLLLLLLLLQLLLLLLMMIIQAVPDGRTHARTPLELPLSLSLSLVDIG